VKLTKSYPAQAKNRGGVDQSPPGVTCAVRSTHSFAKNANEWGTRQARS